MSRSEGESENEIRDAHRTEEVEIIDIRMVHLKSVTKRVFFYPILEHLNPPDISNTVTFHITCRYCDEYICDEST